MTPVVPDAAGAPPVMPAPFSYRLRVLAWRQWSAIVHRRAFGALGDRSFVARPMLVTGHENIEIGDNVAVKPGARIEAHRRFPHRRPHLSIGSGTNIEQNVHIMCQSRIAIGTGVSITGHVAIVDVVHPVDDVRGKVGDGVLDRDTYVEIGDGAFIGYGTVVLPDVRIGAGAVVGANSVVTTDLPADCIAAGAPARVIRQRRGVAPSSDAVPS